MAKHAPEALRQRGPDFFCIGVQKAGTTWLQANLAMAPEIWTPPLKELQYFNQLHIPYHAGWTQRHRDTFVANSMRRHCREAGDLDLAHLRLLAHISDPSISDSWYREIFASAEDRLSGEFTPEYSMLPEEGIEHLFKLSPEAKIILMVRDPIDRCWSQARMHSRRAGENMPTLSEVQSMWDLLPRSDYPGIVRRWRRFLPEDRMLLVSFERVVGEPAAVLADVLRFLGQDPTGIKSTGAGKPVNAGQSVDLPAEIHDYLRELLDPVYRRLDEVLPDEAAIWAARHYR